MDSMKYFVLLACLDGVTLPLFGQCLTIQRNCLTPSPYQQQLRALFGRRIVDGWPSAHMSQDTVPENGPFGDWCGVPHPFRQPKCTAK